MEQALTQVHQRWDVKTGADTNRQIDQTSITPTTIHELIELLEPTLTPTSPRQPGPESTIYSLSATLIAYAIEADGDYHLVISDPPGNTMIAEIPDPLTLDPRSFYHDKIGAARSIFTDRFQQQLITLASVRNLLLHAAASLGESIQPPMINHVSIPISLSGIGFFDFLHGQTGVAPNGIEIHPVLTISFQS